MNRKVILKVHRWLGLAFGVFVFIVCLTGAILIFSPRGHDAPAFFGTVRSLHRFLLMPPENPHGGMSVGRFVVGTTSMAMTLLLLTGLYLWWPKSKKMLKQRLTISTSKGLRRFVYDCHVSLGIYALAFLLLMSLTGPSFSFQWYRKANIALLGGSNEPELDHHAAGHHGPTDGRPHNDVQGPQSQGQHHGQPGGFHQPEGGKMPPQMMIGQLHTGRWGGSVTRVLYCIAALIGASLPLSGYYLWWRRKKSLRRGGVEELRR